jgi:Protein of unknown function (DUF1648)
MEFRPKIDDLQLSPFIRLMHILGFVSLGAMWLYALINWNDLPPTIPIHFNFRGEVDGMGSKASIFGLPAILSFVFALLAVVKSKPHIHNYPVKVTAHNAEALYKLSYNLLTWMQVAINIFGCVIINEIINAAHTKQSSSPSYTLLFFLCAIIFPVFFFLIKSTSLKSSAQ